MAGYWTGGGGGHTHPYHYKGTCRYKAWYHAWVDKHAARDQYTYIWWNYSMHRLNYAILSHCSCTGPYQYSDDLRRISQCGQSPFALAQELGLIQSPLLSYLHRWEALLCNHPDSAFASYILNRLNCGFSRGFDWSTKLSLAKFHLPMITPMLLGFMLRRNWQKVIC